MDLKKAGCKKQGHCYSKRDKARLPVLFLNNVDPVFCKTLKKYQVDLDTDWLGVYNLHCITSTIFSKKT